MSLCETCRGRVKGSKTKLAGQRSLSAISRQHMKSDWGNQNSLVLALCTVKPNSRCLL